MRFLQFFLLIRKWKKQFELGGILCDRCKYTHVWPFRDENITTTYKTYSPSELIWFYRIEYMLNLYFSHVSFFKELALTFAHKSFQESFSSIANNFTRQRGHSFRYIRIFDPLEATYCNIKLTVICFENIFNVRLTAEVKQEIFREHFRSHTWPDAYICFRPYLLLPFAAN